MISSEEEFDLVLRGAPAAAGRAGGQPDLVPALQGLRPRLPEIRRRAHIRIL